MKNNFKILALATVFVVSLSACGGDETKDTTTTTTTTEAPKVETTAPEPAAVNTFEVEANDQMQFSKNELKAVAGKEITLTLKNVGKTEKSVMGHNFVVLKEGTDIAAFATKASSAKETDFIPAADASKIVAHTKLLGPGESDTIKFTLAKGTYDYICSFPGHYALMKGKIIVE